MELPCRRQFRSSPQAGFVLLALFCVWSAWNAGEVREHQGVAQGGEPRRVTVKPVKGTAPPDAIEIRGVSAGRFDPAIWTAGKLHLLPDRRAPLLAPRKGKFRNIYAPSIVQTKRGWDIYYGAWDGVATPNDRIYRASTPVDFLTFSDRRTIIEHGAFEHVCNVNVHPRPDGSLAMMCTTYPDAKGLNKPGFFASPDGGKTWNGSPAPHLAAKDDVITIEGYGNYEDADINGMNVLVSEGGKYRLYFNNFKDVGRVFRATGTDGKRFDYEAESLTTPALVNDVKKFRLGEGDWYLMGLHMNGSALWYALSRDGMSFAPQKELAKSLGADDAYIVAIGFVVTGKQEKRGRKVLGFLYGAGAKPSLDANRIYARWLQKRVILATGNEVFEPSQALGPDRQIVKLPRNMTALVELYAEDGVTLIGRSQPTQFEAGKAYQIIFK